MKYCLAIRVCAAGWVDKGQRLKCSLGNSPKGVEPRQGQIEDEKR